MLQGYLAEGELEFGLNELGQAREYRAATEVRLLGNAAEEGEFDLSMFVDRTPLTICGKAPMEYAVEMFGKLGLRYLCVVEEGSGRLLGVCTCYFLSSPHYLVEGCYLSLCSLADDEAGNYQEAPRRLVRALEKPLIFSFMPCFWTSNLIKSHTYNIPNFITNSASR